jgi:hypothetical protein
MEIRTVENYSIVATDLNFLECLFFARNKDLFVVIV